MVNKNDLIEMNNLTFRVLHISVDRALIINCCQRKMPEWISVETLNECPVSDKVLMYRAIEELSPNERKKALERFAMISRAVAVIDDEKGRSNMIALAAEQFKVSKQSVRSFLWSYLVYQNIGALAPKSRTEKPLTDEQKNFRWALNKYFYTRNQNSLPTAYTMMLKEKYCTPLGELLPDHPTFAQFRYFYRQTRKLENYHISRDGIKKYQRNKRPLLGEDGVQSFAPTIGTAMLDELSHSTGHPSRMNREMESLYQNRESYAIEELRAEIASTYFCTELGVNVSEKQMESHQAYVASWLKAIKEDHNALFSAIKP